MDSILLNDGLSITNLAINVVILIGGWFVRNLLNSFKEDILELHKLYGDLEIRLRQLEMTFVSRSELKEHMVTVLGEIRMNRDELKNHEVRELAWHRETIREIETKMKDTR